MHKLFSRLPTKKGSLSLSINAIVVLILAITMLGLGLAFIRNLFGGAVGKLQDIYAGLSEEDKKTLEASQEQITFLQSDIKLSGREVSFPFAIRNIRGEKIGLKIKNNFFCFDAIGKKDFMNGQLLQALLPVGTLYDSTGSVNTADIDKKIKANQFNPDKNQFGQTPLIQFGTYDDRDLEGNKAVVIPLTVKVAANAPATTYSCAFFPTVIRGIDSTRNYGTLQVPASGLEIYDKKYINIIYSK